MHLAVFHDVVTSHSVESKIRSRLLLLDYRITHKNLLSEFGLLNYEKYIIPFFKGAT